MNLEDTIRRSIADHVDRADLPLVDVETVRRSGDRRRAVTGAVVAAAVLAVVTTGVGLLVGTPDEGRVVQPADLPTLDYDRGTRAWYDEDRAEVHLGGAAFDIGRVPDLDTRASATPWGLVWTADDQSVRLLRADGSVEVLARRVEGGRRLLGNVKFDPVDERVGWLTRTADGTRLTVRPFGDSAGVSREVPCDGDGCERLALGGIDGDRVFVRRLDVDQTLVLDLAEPEAGWTAIDGFRVADVRNRVVLGTGAVPTGKPLGAGWRFVRAQGVESLLTFDGAHELYWSPTLRSTDGGEPLRLDVPVDRGTVFVNLDSDGSVMVSLRTNRASTYYDCDPATGACERFDRGPVADGGFIGNDM